MALHQRPASRVALTVLAVAGIGFTAPLLQASAGPSPAKSCIDAGNVWVHIENDDATDGGCATEFGTGFEALTSAGFTFDAPGGFIKTIDGAPSAPGAEDWWSYAHTDQSLTGWAFYEVGAAESKPAAGSIEAWRLMHTYSQEVSTLPLTLPTALLADVAGTPDPTPTETASMSPSATTDPIPSTPTPSATATATAPPSLPNTGD